MASPPPRPRRDPQNQELVAGLLTLDEIIETLSDRRIAELQEDDDGSANDNIRKDKLENARWLGKITEVEFTKYIGTLTKKRMDQDGKLTDLESAVQLYRSATEHMSYVSYDAEAQSTMGEFFQWRDELGSKMFEMRNFFPNLDIGNDSDVAMSRPWVPEHPDDKAMFAKISAHGNTTEYTTEHLVSIIRRYMTLVELRDGTIAVVTADLKTKDKEKLEVAKSLEDEHEENMRLEKMIYDTKIERSAVESRLADQYKRSMDEVTELKVTLDANKGTLKTRDGTITELTQTADILRQSLITSGESTAVIRSSLLEFATKAKEQEIEITALKNDLTDAKTANYSYEDDVRTLQVSTYRSLPICIVI